MSENTRGRLLYERDCDADALEHEAKHEEENNRYHCENDPFTQMKNSLMHTIRNEWIILHFLCKFTQ